MNGRWLDFRAFFWCTLILGLRREGTGWWDGGWLKKFKLATARVGKATKSSQKGPIPHHKAKEASS